MAQFKLVKSSVQRNRVYEHYRGNRYIVVDIAKDSDREGDWFRVEYRALYDHGQLYSTTIERFTETVEKPEISYKGPRFRLIDIEEEDRNPDHVYPTLTM
jgi:hypothetical protein